MSWRNEVFPLAGVGGWRQETVLVADEVRYPSGVVVSCPAAILVAGELHRAGVPVSRGPVDLGVNEVGTTEAALVGVMAHTAMLDAVDAGRGGEPVAMAVVAGDGPGRAAAVAVMDGWVSVAGGAAGGVGLAAVVVCGGGAGGRDRGARPGAVGCSGVRA